MPQPGRVWSVNGADKTRYRDGLAQHVLVIGPQQHFPRNTVTSHGREDPVPNLDRFQLLLQSVLDVGLSDGALLLSCRCSQIGDQPIQLRIQAIKPLRERIAHRRFPCVPGRDAGWWDKRCQRITDA